jgi:hypothetical protein
MADAIASRLGQANLTGSTDALFLKVFSGEVLAAFAEATYAIDKQIVRTISEGTSAQFPVIGRTTAYYHTPGAELVAAPIAANERIITINDLLVSPVFIGKIDEAKNHYDVRSIYSTELGVALARQMDRHVLQTMVQAALVATPLPSTEADQIGTVIVDLNVSASLSMATDADTLIAGLYLAAENLDNKFVPQEDRTAFLKPHLYNLLANGSKAINVLYNGNTGQNGMTSTGKIMEVAGIKILKTTDLPNTNVTGTGVTAGGAAGRQAVNAANVIGIVTHKSAVGMVKLMDLATEMEYQILRQGTLIVAKYAVGHGVLRPSAAVLLRTT